MTPKIKATKETIRLLRDARMYLYIRRASWFLVAVLLVTLTGFGIHHYILEPRADAKGFSRSRITLKFVTLHPSLKVDI